MKIISIFSILGLAFLMGCSQSEADYSEYSEYTEFEDYAWEDDFDWDEDWDDDLYWEDDFSMDRLFGEDARGTLHNIFADVQAFVHMASLQIARVEDGLTHFQVSEDILLMLSESPEYRDGAWVFDVTSDYLLEQPHLALFMIAPNGELLDPVSTVDFVDGRLEGEFILHDVVPGDYIIAVLTDPEILDFAIPGIAEAGEGIAVQVIHHAFEIE